jgi:hypothetical protein
MRDEERLAHRTSIQKRERENRKEIAPLVHHGSDGKARLPDRPALKLRFDCRWHAASSRVARHADERTDCSMMFVADRKHRHCHCNCHCNREKRGGARRRLTVHRPSRCFDIPWIGSRRLVWSRNSLNANDDTTVTAIAAINWDCKNVGTGRAALVNQLNTALLRVLAHISLTTV